MKRSIASLLLVVLATAVAPSGASHIAIAGPVWYSAGPGTNRVVFEHVEKESTLCCAGGPEYDFGDGTAACLCEVLVNQDTPAGTYTAVLYSTETWEEIGTFPYRLSHIGEPPLPEGAAHNTVLSFEHTFPAPDLYTVRWVDCCFGTPQVPQEVPDPARDIAQGVVDEVWGDVVQPLVVSLEDVEPFGIDHGTAHVYAL